MSEGLNSAVRTISLLLLSLWLGAALFFSAAVAPAVFGVLRDSHVPNANEVAGAIVTRSLSVVNVSGFAIGFGLLGLMVVAARRNLRQYVPWILVLTIMAVATAVGQWIITPKMQALRTAMGLIDQVSRDDPRRVAFDNLHRYSVLSLAVAMCAAIAALLLTRLRRIG
jgi:Domain of unknown function (DUF4149)